MSEKLTATLSKKEISALSDLKRKLEVLGVDTVKVVSEIHKKLEETYRKDLSTGTKFALFAPLRLVTPAISHEPIMALEKYVYRVTEEVVLKHFDVSRIANFQVFFNPDLQLYKSVLTIEGVVFQTCYAKPYEKSRLSPCAVTLERKGVRVPWKEIVKGSVWNTEVYLRKEHWEEFDRRVAFRQRLADLRVFKNENGSLQAQVLFDGRVTFEITERASVAYRRIARLFEHGSADLYTQWPGIMAGIGWRQEVQLTKETWENLFGPENVIPFGKNPLRIRS